MFSQSTKAIYLQIVDRIGDEILAGRYGEDERLPSVREYATAIEVNSNTVMRSYDWLASHEIIYNRRGIGFFVARGAIEKIKQMRRDELFNGSLSQFFSRLSQLDITPEQLAELYRSYNANHK